MAGIFQKKTIMVLIIALAIGAGLRWFLKNVRLPSRLRLEGPVGANFAAKLVCSSVHISGRDAAAVIKEDLSDINPAMRLLVFDVDDAAKTVKASYLGYFLPATAVYRPGMGCALHMQESSQKSEPGGFTLDRPSRKQEPIEEWPVGNHVEESKLNTKIQKILEDYAEQERRDTGDIRTRQLVVVHNGKIIGDFVKPGFHKNQKLLGWSMTKSVLGLLVGRLVKLGKLSLADKGLFSEWKDDNRATISIEDLLRMSSGLQWQEVYSARSTATEMLFLGGAVSQSARQHPLEHTPGAFFRYSSADTNLLSEIVRRKVGDTFASYAEFVRSTLLEPLNLRMFFEPDSTGTIVGSSFGWGSARDWAKLGLFTLQDGVWNGERILPEGWRDLSRQVTTNSSGHYGAHWWLPGDEKQLYDGKNYTLPTGSMLMSGFQGQFVLVCEKEKLVVARIALDKRVGVRGSPKLIHDILSVL